MAACQAQATASELATETKSLALIRNMLRLNVSQVLYNRGCLPESDFESRDVNGLRVQSLGGESSSDSAKTIIDWLEKGVFAALQKNYLGSTPPPNRIARTSPRSPSLTVM